MSGVRSAAVGCAAALRVFALAINFLILSSPPQLQRWVGGDTRPYVVATLLLAVVNLALVMSWRRIAVDGDVPTALFVGRIGVVAVAVVTGGMLLIACRAWLHQILTIPHDPQRADMLIVVQLGIRRMLQGKNPYTMYHVPWDAPLPYGPMLWAPYVVPFLLRADIRFVTVVGELFVPVACALGAVTTAARGRWFTTIAWTSALAAMCFNPDLERFASIGHTPAYWPLIALFAWLVATDRWDSAAIAMGLLVVARTTMVAVAPVFLMAVWWHARPRLLRVLLLTLLSAVLPFVPFAIWDPSALSYALYGSYQNVMKGFVWPSTTWVQHTIGITGLLLSNRLSRWVEAVQIVVMLAVYVTCWRAIRDGRPSLPWMALALLAFSMTTLWPVTYIYFDVFLLLACAALAGTPWLKEHARHPSGMWIATLAAASILVVATAWAIIPGDSTFDIGTPAARPFLRSGFGDDKREGERTFAWVDGRHAAMLVPRRASIRREGVTVELECLPFLPTEGLTQQISAVLNGVSIGTAALPGGWHRASFTVPARAWQIGVNELELFLSSSVSPAESGVGNDARQLSVAIDRLTVQSR